MSSKAYRFTSTLHVDPATVSPVSVAAAKSVLNALAWYSDEGGENAHPGAAVLSTHTGLSVRSIRRALAALVSAGYIIDAGLVRADGVKVRSTIYTVLIDSQSAAPTGDKVTPHGDSVTGDSVTPHGDSVTAKGDSVTAKGDSVTPKQVNSNNRNTLDMESPADFSAVCDAWLGCTRHQKRRGHFLTSSETNALLVICRKYETLDILSAIDEIDKREYPRPLIPWIGDKIENRKKRKSKKGNRTESINQAWDDRSPVAGSRSIFERLNERGKK